MINILFDEISGKLNDHYRTKNLPLFKCTVGDISMHDKNSEAAGDVDIDESVILSLVSIEEENAMKNNYPIKQIGSSFIQEKSAVYINIYLLFSSKYKNYDTALEAISHVISCFQVSKKVFFMANDVEQEAILNLHNLGFENLNNLWTVLGGRYLPSVIYKARILIYQQSPPLNGALITDIREKELM